MDSGELYLACIAQATEVVKQVLPSHFGNATPDSDWNVHDLIGHMLYELSWIPDMLGGKTIEAVGKKYDGDLIGDDDYELANRWQAAADKAENAVTYYDPDATTYLSYGEVSAEDYLRDAGIDELIHAWDLGKAIGVTVHFDLRITNYIYEFMLPKRAELAKSGLFAAALDVAETADTQTKLLGIFGRDAGWVAN